MKSKPTNLKIFYYIWAVLLLVLLGSYVLMDLDTSVLVAAIILLFGGASLFRSWKNSVTEIEIKEGVAYMTMMDGKEKAIYINAIVQIRDTTNGFHLRFADGEEVRTRKGKNKVVIRNGENVTSEFREEDFPFAEFKKLK